MKKSPHNMPVKDRFERFFVRGEPNDCWLWLGNPDKKGYGRFRTKDKPADKSHRMAYRLYKGEIPAGMEILHSCDRQACVNPAHLSVGTTLRNQHEAWARDLKRNVRKLSPQDIIEIRASSESQTILGKRFGITQPHISRIKNGIRGHGIMMMIDGIPEIEVRSCH
jgi:hypothetical protein